MSTKKLSVGGQAVIEGVMMRGPHKVAVAVRQPDGEIAVDVNPVNSIRDKYPILKKPLLRGVIALFESLYDGIKALAYSAQVSGEEDEQLTGKEMAMTIATSVLLAVGLFIVIPTWSMRFLHELTEDPMMLNLAEGVLRMVIFLAYIAAISSMEDIQRVFQYHGAEHKTIACYEAEDELVPARAKKYSRLHPRCGTAFLFLVMFISILIGAIADQLLFALFGIEKLTFVGRILRSVLTIPVVTGVSYEVLKGLAHAGDSLIVRILRWPGMMLQYLTTREPDDSMLEVAIASMKAAKAGPAHYGENLDANVYVYGAKGKKPEPAGDGQANENAPDEAREDEKEDEKEVEKEDEKNDEKKDGASA